MRNCFRPPLTITIFFLLACPSMAKKRATPKKRVSTKRAPKPSLTLDLLVTCDAVSRDPNTSKASLYGVFDIIFGEKFPLHYGSAFAIFAQLSGTGRHAVAIELQSPGADPVELAQLPVVFKSGGRAVVQMTLVGVTFEKPGAYMFQLRSEGKLVGSPRTIQVKRKPRKKR